MANNWYRMTVDETAQACHTDLKTGLRHKAVKQALRLDGENAVYPIVKSSFYDCLRRVLFDYTTVLLLLCAIIASVFGADNSAGVLAVTVVLHLAISVAVYTRSQHVLEGMEYYSLPVARVIRNGRLYMVAQKKLVRGDIIYLSEGDIVPADVRLISSKNLYTQEDNLFPVTSLTEKDALMVFPYRTETDFSLQGNMAFASTLVVSGEAQGIVVETGEDTIVCRLKKNEPIISHTHIPVIPVLEKYSRVWSLCMLGVVFVLTMLEIIMNREATMFSAFLTGLSMAVSSMSELLVPFATIVLACGIYSGIRRYKDINSGFIIKRTASVAKLKDISCLIVPKEGVFTRKEFQAAYICTANHTYAISDTQRRSKINRVALYALLSTGQYGASVIADREQYARRGEEDVSIIAMAKKMGMYSIALDTRYPLIDHVRKGKHCQFDTTLFRNGNAYIAAMHGSPAEILYGCDFYVSGGAVLPLDGRSREKIMSMYRKMAQRNYHMIAVSSKKSVYSSLRFPAGLHQGMVFEGFVSLRVPFLRGVTQTVRHCQDAGIKVILLCERDEDENRYFAEHIGILNKPGELLTVKDYEAQSADIKQKTASYYKVYSGLGQKQLSELIRNLQQNGERVGYLGSNLMDLQVMREADVTFAKNITISSRTKSSLIPMENDVVTASTAEIYSHNGCEALKFVSDVIVSDADARGNGGFNAMADAVAYAKLIDRNMINMIRYLYTSQFARLLVVLFSILSGSALITPIQVIFLGLIVDFISVLIFAFERPEDEVLYAKRGAVERLVRPKREFRYAAAYGALWGLFCISFSFLPKLLHVPATAEQCSSAAFVLSVLLQMMVLISYKRDRFIFRRGARFSGIFILYFLVMTELFALFFLIPSFGAVFGVYGFSSLMWRLVGVLAMSFIPFCEVLKHFYHKQERVTLTKQEKLEKKEKKKEKENSRKEKKKNPLAVRQEEILNGTNTEFADVSKEIDSLVGHYVANAESEDSDLITADAIRMGKTTVTLNLPHLTGVFDEISDQTADAADTAETKTQATKTFDALPISPVEEQTLRHLFTICDDINEEEPADEEKQPDAAETE